MLRCVGIGRTEPRIGIPAGGEGNGRSSASACTLLPLPTGHGGAGLVKRPMVPGGNVARTAGHASARVLCRVDAHDHLIVGGTQH